MPRLIGRVEVRSLTQRAPLFSQHPPSGQLITPRRSSRETSVPSKMTREELGTLVIGLCDHRLAAIEERVAALERVLLEKFGHGH
jgi:hypothetical protein